MLNGAALQSVLLAAVCLSSRAVPIGSSADRCCDRHEESATLEKKDRRLSEVNRIIRTPSPEKARAFLFHPSSSTHNPDAFTSERSHSSAPEEDINGSHHEGLGRNQNRALGLDDGTQSADGQQGTQTSASILDHLLVSVHDSSAADLQTADPFIRENAESSDRPSESRKTDYIQPGDQTISSALSRTAQQKDRRSEADVNTRRLSLVPSDSSDPTSASRPDRTLGFRTVDVTDVWTEPAHLQREEVSVEPSGSQDLLTDVTMSSEDLPLIFEPLDGVTPPGSSTLLSELPVATAPTAVTVEDAGLMVSMETEHASSDVSLSGMLDWPSSWQTSETEKTSVVTSSQMQIKRPDAEPEQTKEHRGMTQNDDITQMMTDVIQLSTSETKTEDLESKEEPDEDENDEGLDSDEEESEEDLTEATTAPVSRPPHSLIPPPPVWMQGKQGLVRSWVELIREKAGYVSGMLAPVGIGIAGALLLVGALYSIREIHRRRRDNIKHQRNRPVREVRTGPDNAMLLADSSEDEF